MTDFQIFLLGGVVALLCSTLAFLTFREYAYLAREGDRKAARVRRWRPSRHR